MILQISAQRRGNETSRQVWLQVSKYNNRGPTIDYIDSQKAAIFESNIANIERKIILVVGYCKLLSFSLLCLSFFQIFKSEMQGHNPLSLSSIYLSIYNICIYPRATLAEQDWMTNLGYSHPELIHILPCQFNAQTSIQVDSFFSKFYLFF